MNIDCRFVIIQNLFLNTELFELRSYTGVNLGYKCLSQAEFAQNATGEQRTNLAGRPS